MAISNEQILNDINQFILSGGRRTTASNVRTLLTEVVDSYPNLIDGGNIFQSLVGYTSELTLTDRKNFVHKGYVDDLIGADLTPYFKKDGSVAATGSFNMNGHNITGIFNLIGGGSSINFGLIDLSLGAAGNLVFGGLNVQGNSSGNYYFTAGTDFTIDSVDGLKLTKSGSGVYGIIKTDNILSDVTLQVGNAGTIAVTSDINSTNIIAALGYTPANAATTFIQGGNAFTSASYLGLTGNYALTIGHNSETIISSSSSGVIIDGHGHGLTLKDSLNGGVYFQDGGGGVYFNMNGGEVAFNDNGGGGFYVASTGGEVSWTVSSAPSGNTLGWTFSSATGAVMTDGRSSPKGIQYSADYSAGFDARSLIDKGYADGKYATLSGSTAAFLNGGNSFGAGATLGTNDNYSLIFKTNNITALTFDTSQNTTLSADLILSGSTKRMRLTDSAGVTKNVLQALSSNNLTFAGEFAVLTIAPSSIYLANTPVIYTTNQGLSIGRNVDITATVGGFYNLRLSTNYTPGAGSTTYNVFQLDGNITPASGATGTIRSIYINHTLGTIYGSYYAIEATGGDFKIANRCLFDVSKAQFSMPVELPSYSKSSLPTVSSKRLIWVTDDVGGACVSYCDGTNWKRIDTNAVIS